MILEEVQNCSEPILRLEEVMQKKATPQAKVQVLNAAQNMMAVPFFVAFVVVVVV